MSNWIVLQLWFQLIQGWSEEICTDNTSPSVGSAGSGPLTPRRSNDCHPTSAAHPERGSQHQCNGSMPRANVPLIHKSLRWLLSYSVCPWSYRESEQSILTIKNKSEGRSISSWRNSEKRKLLSFLHIRFPRVKSSLVVGWILQNKLIKYFLMYLAGAFWIF